MFLLYSTRGETPHHPQSFRRKTFRPLKFDNRANIQHQFNNYPGHAQQKHQEQQQRPGLRFGWGRPGYYRNGDLTKEHKDKDIINKCFFLFNSGSVNCGQFVEFEGSHGCLYENSNYKYQCEKQETRENKIEFEYGDSHNSGIKNIWKQNIKFWSETLKAKKAIVNVLKERCKLPLCTVPKSAHHNNNKSVITYWDFVSEAIQSLLKRNRIIEVNELPHAVNPLLVTV